MGDDGAVTAIRIRCADVLLRPASADDLVALAAMLPDDYELDPTAAEPGTPRATHLLRTCRRDRAAFRSEAWALHLAASAPDGRLLGMQTVEATDFAEDRVVDSASWVAASERGRGAGRAMRAGMLALAFDGLGARRAVTSAWRENAASLAVSARLGYVLDRVERRSRDDGSGEGDLLHLRLDADGWRSALRPQVELQGLSQAARSAFV